MNKFFICLLILSSALISNVNAEGDSDFQPSKNAFAKVYSNFHLGISSSDQNSAFEITRAYFGYKHKFDKEFSAIVKLDIGSPNDESQYSLLKRYAYFKNAALQYHKNNLTVNFGLIDLTQFKTQEKFWGKRYIFKSFQDEYKFGSSADIGASVFYKINPVITVDAAIMNGEGYKTLQSDNTYQTAFGVTFTPFDFLTARLFYDFTSKSIIESNYAGFIGFKYDKYKLAFEYNLEQNYKFYDGHNMYGYSIYGSYKLFSSIELFGRYDILRSNKIDNAEIPWNLSKDGSAIIGGIQYQPHNRIKIAIDYQDWYPYAKDEANLAYLYFNVEFSF